LEELYVCIYGGGFKGNWWIGAGALGHDMHVLQLRDWSCLTIKICVVEIKQRVRKSQNAFMAFCQICI
jgi:hypothetical protein